MRYSSLICLFGCSLSLLLPQCSIPVRTLVRDRELQKKDLASVTLVFGVFGLPLNWAFLRLPFVFRKERELGPYDAQRECAENVE